MTQSDPFKKSKQTSASQTQSPEKVAITQPKEFLKIQKFTLSIFLIGRMILIVIVALGFLLIPIDEFNLFSNPVFKYILKFGTLTLLATALYNTIKKYKSSNSKFDELEKNPLSMEVDKNEVIALGKSKN